ncbi:hypothetical protein WMY93_008304 [Mugilogobius chulae]|uniref:Uncharacterized protein n=1 Tax=Mugilogobius chulae TaxID=88201 RepID=A0AAW0PUF0_9GOBI
MSSSSKEQIMHQLSSFVQQKLRLAAEEVLGQVERALDQGTETDFPSSISATVQRCIVFTDENQPAGLQQHRRRLSLLKMLKTHSLKKMDRRLTLHHTAMPATVGEKWSKATRKTEGNCFRAAQRQVWRKRF